MKKFLIIYLLIFIFIFFLSQNEIVYLKLLKVSNTCYFHHCLLLVFTMVERVYSVQYYEIGNIIIFHFHQKFPNKYVYTVWLKAGMTKINWKFSETSSGKDIKTKRRKIRMKLTDFHYKHQSQLQTTLNYL